MPMLLTPGAAEALVVKAYRHVAHAATSRRRRRSRPASIGYQNPVPADVLELPDALAVREATDLTFVPPALRKLARDRTAA